MKTLFLACSVMLIFCSSGVYAQSSLDEPGNHVVVIGAFTSQTNAEKLASVAKKNRMKAEVELNKIRNLYYVYVMETSDKAVASSEVWKLRNSGSYNDAWVYHGPEIVKEEPKVEPVIPPVEEPKVEIKATVITPVPEMDSVELAHEKIKKEVDEKAMVMKKGEMETLNFIYFFKDAAVLRPESRFEVDRLVALMDKHPTEKICIHGHTNGNDDGKIIRMRDTSGDFFSLANTEEDYGSAKQLSEMRAGVIRDYLVKNGIDHKRISIKAWGGKKPLYEVDDDRAEANVRVEVEVLHN